MSLRRITVALGGSEYMDAAMAEAIDIAKRNGAELVGLAVMDLTLVDPVQAAPIGGAAAAAELREQREQLVRDGMREAVAEFTAVCEKAGLPFRIVETDGDAQEAITEAMKLSDLGIVGIRHAFDYGTIAHDDAFLARVARGSNRPIIAMTAPARPIRRILVAYDGSQVSADAIRSFCVLNAFDPQIVRVVSSIEGGDADQTDRRLAEARGYLELHGYTVETVVLDGPPSTAILEHARAFDADVVVMGAVGRRGLSKLLAGDTASRLLSTSDIPLFLRR